MFSLALPALAQPAPPPPPAGENSPEEGKSPAGPEPRKGPPGKRGDGEAGRGESPEERFKRKLDKLSPEDRERFKQNWERWKKMGEKERDELRERADQEQERIRRTIDDAIARAGLTLDKDQREVFALRYRQERRKIEEDLRREFEKVRSVRIDRALEKLKAEFTPANPAGETAPSPTPTASPTPAP